MMAYILRVTDSGWRGGYIARKTKGHPAGVVSQKGMAIKYRNKKSALGAASRIMSTRCLTAVPEAWDSEIDISPTERGNVFHQPKQ
jgi:hypothetical protein